MAAWSQQSGMILNDPSIHYFKEALTAAIMNQPEFRSFFNYTELFHSETYRGNPELHDLSIEHDGTAKNIVAFFEKGILQSPDGYRTSMHRVLKAFVAAGHAFVEKWNLWNQMPNDPDTQNELMRKYGETIRLV